MQGSISECTVDHTIVIRADGNGKIGFGHIYRMLAVIEMLRDSVNNVVFVSQELPAELEEAFKSLNIEYKTISTYELELPDKQDSYGVALDLTLSGDELVILDGYHFGLEYQRAIKKLGCKLVYIDDLGGTEFVADAVINHAPAVHYPSLMGTKFFTGMNYAMLRKPFFTPLNFIKKQRVAYICLGGSDFFSHSLKLLDLINMHGDFETINLVFSSQYPESLIGKFKKYKSRISLKLHSDLNAREMVSILDKSTHAFVSASTVLLECYSRGLSCYTGYYTKNQFLIYEGFVKENKAIGLGDLDKLDSDIFKDCLKNSPETLSEPLKSRSNLLKMLSEL